MWGSQGGVREYKAGQWSTRQCESACTRAYESTMVRSSVNLSLFKSLFGSISESVYKSV
jgi:hypothetical protein